MNFDMHKFLHGDRFAHPRLLDIEDVLYKMENKHLEETHDYIQWCFPTDEPSVHVPWSPYLKTMRQIQEVKDDVICRIVSSVLRERMLKFYAETDDWLQEHDHNHARITRILKSTRLLWGMNAAMEWRLALTETVGGRQGKINKDSIMIWHKVVYR